MLGQDAFDATFVIFALSMQVILSVFFAFRKWRFATAIKHGWVVYALSIPAALVSIALIIGGKAWTFWLAGFLYVLWAALGYYADVVRSVDWRTRPIVWPVFLPYVILYMGMQMFYWWPLAEIHRSLWFIYAVLFVISTVLNITSHKTPD